MQKSLGSFLVLSLAFGCSVSGFDKSTPNTRAAAASSTSSTPSTAAEGIKSESLPATADSQGVIEGTIKSGESVNSEIIKRPEAAPIQVPDTAVIPVPIGGAPLTCIRSKNAASDVRCEMKTDTGAASTELPVAVYLISGKDAVQTKVAITASGAGAFSFAIPSRLQSLQAFGVAAGFNASSGSFRRFGGYGGFRYGNRDVVMAMVGFGKTDLNNVVLDQSFEEHSVASNEPSLYVEQGNFKSWKARNKVDTGCIDISPIIEIQQNYGTAKAFEGKQWIDLDGGCAEDYSKTAGNIAIYQDLTVKADHVYAISFAQKRNPNSAAQQKLSVTWGDEKLFEQDTDTEWTVHTTLRTVSANSIRIDFGEIGFSDGYGTLLDDVRVYDLGLPELP